MMRMIFGGFAANPKFERRKNLKISKRVIWELNRKDEGRRRILSPFLISVFFREALGALDLGAGFEAAFPASADPIDRIGPLWDEACFGTPRDDELPGASTTSDTVDDDRFIGRMVFVHECEELIDLLVARNSVVGNVDKVVVEALGDVLAIVELADIDDGFDPFVLEELEDIGIGPPGSGDHSFDDPSKGFGALRLSALGPVGRANGH